jgi:hypothetical protein
MISSTNFDEYTKFRRLLHFLEVTVSYSVVG